MPPLPRVTPAGVREPSCTHPAGGPRAGGDAGAGDAAEAQAQAVAAGLAGGRRVAIRAGSGSRGQGSGGQNGPWAGAQVAEAEQRHVAGPGLGALEGGRWVTDPPQALLRGSMGRRLGCCVWAGGKALSKHLDTLRHGGKNRELSSHISKLELNGGA